jgi:hypothetical protein
MERKDRKRERSPTETAKTAALDKTEAGPSRLYAPGKPREVESGPSRLQPATPRGQQLRNAYQASSTGSLEPTADTAEAGPARIVRYRK